MEINELEKKIENLENAINKDELVKGIQVIMRDILENFDIEISGKTINPVSLEAYYKDQNNTLEEDYADCKPTQKDGFNKKVHFKSECLNASNLRNRIDLCLSNNDRVYFSALVKCAEIDNEILGQYGVYKKIIENGHQNAEDYEYSFKKKISSGNNEIKFIIRKGLHTNGIPDLKLLGAVKTGVRGYKFW